LSRQLAQATLPRFAHKFSPQRFIVAPLSHRLIVLRILLRDMANDALLPRIF